MLVTINQVENFVSKAIANQICADDLGIRLQWRFQKHLFVAKFYKSEPIMHVGLINGTVELESIELPYDPKTNMQRLVQELKLRKVSEVLLHQARQVGLVDGVKFQ
ncbi:hypothetical protein THIAE_06060 [Thiomicrospira aerophila AL3]|uniref:Uncharacterized protein n=1 Tax=Thiomicrospira aerophila AL3 TaxID=717772 RepID=W0DZL2_9GAMM|nr:hypothetical protein [Thiomicrospira aerophila]AHF02286.1 hypothetical protein THIAE_06060 [Thiomicrospira aerophila AL3]